MPEVVTAFLETKQIGKVLAVQRRIVDEYKSDMVKYAAVADKSRIRECFESIPAQLAREYKKFSYTVVRPGGRGRDYAGSLQWIEDAISNAEKNNSYDENGKAIVSLKSVPQAQSYSLA